jgi:hypothetical protein
VLQNNRKEVEDDGERGRNRTYNLLIKSQLLCQLSYAPFNDLRTTRRARCQLWCQLDLTKTSARTSVDPERTRPARSTEIDSNERAFILSSFATAFSIAWGVG